MIMNCSLSNVTTDFFKGRPPDGISTGLFLLGNMIHKIKERQMLLVIIIIA